MDDETIKRQAEEFARANRKRLAEGLTDINKYSSAGLPISIFMAGSPGAGKTEFSKNLLDILEKDLNQKTVRIDSDELRNLMPGYTGRNSYLFQTAVSLIVERIHDLVIDNKQTFILDGTLSKYNKAADNIRRSLSKSRIVRIFYLYQKPEVAWKYTLAREVVEGRNIPKNVFIQQYIDSRETIEKIRKDFGYKLGIFIVKKDFETHKVEDIILCPKDDSSIDQYLGIRYTKEDLEKLL